MSRVLKTECLFSRPEKERKFRLGKASANVLRGVVAGQGKVKSERLIYRTLRWEIGK